MSTSGANKPPALLHIGYPKTGTTYLQKSIFSNSEFGFGIPGGSDSRAYITEWFLTDDQYKFEPETIVDKMTQLEGPVRAQKLIPVWSEETILGNPLNRRYDGPWMLEKFRALGIPFKVLITIRKQTDWILSSYREFLKLNRHTITDFIGKGDEAKSYRPIIHPEYLCYDIAAEKWGELFGPKNILVLPQELLRLNPDEFVKRVAAFSGISNVPAPPAQDHNVGLRGTALIASRISNHFYVQSPLSARKPKSVRVMRKALKLIDRLSPRMLDREIERHWTRIINDRFNGYYDESNHRLEILTGANLGEFGYPVRKQEISE